MTTSFRADVVKHALRLGAEVKNIRLSYLSDEVIAPIKQLLLDHKVIFFRDQGHLDDAQQQRFAIRLSSLISHPTMVGASGDLGIRKTHSNGASPAAAHSPEGAASIRSDSGRSRYAAAVLLDQAI